MFVNRFTYDPTALHVYEKVIGESETIPDQSYTIEEIISRFTGGIMPTVNNRIYYDDDPDFDSTDPTMSPDYDLVDALSDMDALYRQFEARKTDDPVPAEQEPPEDNKAPQNEPDNT